MPSKRSAAGQWIWLNGHAWAKGPCENAGTGYTALDIGSRDYTGPRVLQQPRRSRDARRYVVARHLYRSACEPAVRIGR